MKTKFYSFHQNNSGGNFIYQDNDALTHYVIIEADSADDANERAESIGIYFDGVDSDRDCPCCGDRWDRVSREYGTEVPMVYGFEVYINDKFKVNPDLEKKVCCILVEKGHYAVAIHYKDGTIRKECKKGG